MVVVSIVDVGRDMSILRSKLFAEIMKLLCVLRNRQIGGGVVECLGGKWVGG